MSFSATVFGLIAGLLIGCTGVGAGSLMTPLLLTVFGLSLPVAVGTDLWFAALTKMSGAIAHARQGHVDRRIVGLLLAGSLPAAAVTTLLMRRGTLGEGGPLLSLALGVALLLTAAVVALRGAWQPVAQAAIHRRLPAAAIPPLTIALGVALGILVTLSSVGAGAIGATLLLLLHPALSSRRLVGTDIAHAVPLTLAAGIGHAMLGHVDWPLVAALLAGSIPGIWIGARLTRRLPERLTRTLLSAALTVAGLRIIA